MVHKKYTYKKGKRYGPYLYENKRVNGKIVTTYLGAAKEKSSHRNKIFVIGIFVLLAVLLLFFYNYQESFYTGRATLDIKSDYVSGDDLEGDLKLSLKTGELIPKDTMVVISLGGESKEFVLGDLISKNVVSGDFYVENVGIAGNGEGYGLIGGLEIFPNIDFDLRIFDIVSGDGVVDRNGGSGGDVGGGEQEDGDEDDEGETDGGFVEEELIEEDAGEEIIEEREGTIDEGVGEFAEEEEIVEEEVSDEVVDEENVEEVEDVEVEQESEESDSGVDSGDEAGITGSVISDSMFIVSGVVSKDNDFSYNLEEDQSTELVSGSVHVGGEAIGDGEIELNIGNDVVVVSTVYSVLEEGFGEKYLGIEKLELNIGLDEFGFIIKNDSLLNIKFIYDDVTLVEAEKDISVGEKIVDEIIEEEEEGDIGEIIVINGTDVNLSLGNESEIDIDVGNETNIDIVNETLQNVSFNNVSLDFVDVNVTQFSARLGEPVKWVTRINSSKAVNLTVEIPISAENVSFKRIDKAIIEKEESIVGDGETIEEDISEETIEEDNSDVVGNGVVDDSIVEKNVSLDEEEATAEEGSGEIVEFVEEVIRIGINGNVISGKVTAELELRKESTIVRWFRSFLKLTGFVVSEENVQEILVEVNDSVGGVVEIEYYTDAPSIGFEEENENGKRVMVRGSDEVNYTDVLIYTELNESLNIIDGSRVKIFWEEDDKYVPVHLISDLDGNGIYDYVEWIAPHLSNQTFEIILITKAEHLDSNRSFISDIFEEVKELDGIWSEEIPVGDYVRVTFEVNLSSDRDITLWPRIVSGTPRIEVYEINGGELIAEFSDLSEGKKRVILEGLVGEQDSFDLKVLDGNIEIDHIIDPTEVCGGGVCNVTFTTSETWVVPDGVTNITILAVGGGGEGSTSSGGGDGGNGGDLRYLNGISVISGETLTVIVGTGGTGGTSVGDDGGFSRISNSTSTLLEAAGGGGGTTSGPRPQNGSSTTISGVVSGGDGGIGGVVAFGNDAGGGGGAGGYSGAGGDGGDEDQAGFDGSGGGGGGGGAGFNNDRGGGGGGVGLGGEGVNGTGGIQHSGDDGDQGEGGSGGVGGGGQISVGGAYGGGGGGDDNAAEAGDGGAGAVVITYSEPETTPPTFDEIPGNVTLSFNVSLAYDINATDETGFDNFVVNDSRFSINQSGFLINNSMIGVATYLLNVTINDSSNNQNSTVFAITVDAIGSNVNLVVGGEDGDITINDSETILLNGTQVTGDSGATLRLYNDGSIININSDEVSNSTIFETVGDFNITVIYLATQNFTQSSEQHNVTVDNVAPTQGTPIVNSTDGSNSTNVNITVYNQSTADADGDSVKNIYNWYINDSSFEIVNMPFEGGSDGSLTKDYSGFSINGTVTNAIYNSTGGYGGFGAYEFDGDQDRISISGSSPALQDLTDDGNSFSFVGWHKTTSCPANDGGDSYIIFRLGFHTGFAMDDPTCNLWGVLWNASNSVMILNTNQNLNLTVNEWHHLAMTVNEDTNEFKVYFNGVQAGSTFTIHSPLRDYGTANYFIGGDSGGNNNWDVNGSVDDVRIYNRSLSAEQVAAIYNNGTDRIVSQETIFGETWKGCITPNDGLVDGDELCNNLTVLDRAAPNVTINFPTNTTYRFSAMPLIFNVTIGVNGSVMYSLDGGVNNVSMTSTDEGTSFGLLFNYTNGSIEGGGYEFVVYANDTEGNNNYSEAVNFSVEPFDVDDCVTLDTAGTYTLNQSISADGTCITIDSNDVILVGNGKSITFGNTDASSRGVTITGYNNSVLRGLNITNGDVFLNSSFGVQFNVGATNNTLTNSTIFLKANNGARCVAIDGANNHGNSVHNNTLRTEGISTNVFGIAFTEGSSSNIITQNNISGNGTIFVGILLNADNKYTNITFNTIATYGTSTDNTGILLASGSNYSLVAFNNITTDGLGNDNLGIELRVSDSNNVSFNKILTGRTNSNDGIEIDDSDFNELIGNDITTNSSTGQIGSHGFIFKAGSHNNFIQGGTLNHTQGDGIRINDDSENNLFDNIVIANTVLDRWDFRIVEANTDNITFRDMPQILNYSISNGKTAGSLVVVIDSSFGEIKFLEGINGTGTNFSNDIRIANNSVTVETDNNLGLNRSANVTLYGIGNRFTTPEVKRDGLTCPVGICNNFTELNATNVIFNVSAWTNYSVGEKNRVPTQGTPIINSTDGSNSTNVNITIYNQSTADVDDDRVKNIYNWYIDDNSFEGLNMPFEGGSDGTSTKDYSGYSNNGTVDGATWNSTGGYDGFGAYEFDGVNDGITVSDSDSVSQGNAHTLSAWVYDIGGTGYRDIMRKNNEFLFRIDSDGEGGDISCFVSIDGSLEPRVTADVISENEWHHMVCTWDNSTGLLEVYIDGTLNATQTGRSGNITPTSNNFIIGGGGSFWNGSIDDVRFYNRSLSAEQIAAIYNNRTDRIVSQETDLGQTWKGCITPNDGTADGDELCNSLVVSDNNAPTAPTPILNSTLGTNKTAQDLLCNDELVDPDGDAMNVSVWWFNESILHLYEDYNDSSANASAFAAILDSANTTKGQNWTCGIKLYDGVGIADQVNSTSLELVNTAPTVTLSTPTDASTTTDRSPTFTWTENDDDGDTITARLNITLIASSACSDASIHVQSISGASQTIPQVLKCFFDNADYYNWTVNISDGEESSGWANFFRINISSELIISLPTSSVDFLDIGFQGTNDTSDDSPAPLIIQNDGNALMNITIDADDLWNEATNPTSNYQFKIGNNSNENASYSELLSIITYANIPASGSPTLAIALLEYANSTDSAEIDINVTVPADEISGAKGSTVTLTSSLTE